MPYKVEQRVTRSVTPSNVFVKLDLKSAYDGVIKNSLYLKISAQISAGVMANSVVSINDLHLQCLV